MKGQRGEHLGGDIFVKTFLGPKKGRTFFLLFLFHTDRAKGQKGELLGGDIFVETFS